MVVKTFSMETAASQIHKKNQEEMMNHPLAKLEIVHSSDDERRSHQHHHRPMNSGSAGVLFVSSLSTRDSSSSK